MKKIFSNFAIISVALLGLSLSSSSSAGERKVPADNSEMILSFSPIVKKASPTVVNIYTKKKVTVRKKFSPFLNDPIFKHFFGDSFLGGKNTQRIESSLGSGIIVKNNGLIVTNNHVVAGANDIRIVLSDRREFPAKVILNDERADLALLKIEVKDEKLPYIKLMDSDDLEVGDIVIAIGNPFGVGQTVTNGIVSAVADTTIGASNYHFFIQTNAAINPGNSGGALINMEGKLAGLNTAIFSKSGGSNGLGFAIPSNMVATVIRGADGQVVRPWLGVSVQSVTMEIASSLGLKRPVGAIISSIHPKSPAAKSGLKVGDIVRKVGKHEIMDDHSLYFRIATYKIGAEASFEVIRKGATKNIKVKMESPPEYPKRDLRTISGKNPLSGAIVGNLSPALTDELGLNIMVEGVIITSINRGISSNIGFHKKDIIKSVNGIEIKTSVQLEKLVKRAQTKWKVTIQRGSRLLNIIWNVVGN